MERRTRIALATGGVLMLLGAGTAMVGATSDHNGTHTPLTGKDLERANAAGLA